MNAATEIVRAARYFLVDVRGRPQHIPFIIYSISSHWPDGRLGENRKKKSLQYIIDAKAPAYAFGSCGHILRNGDAG